MGQLHELIATEGDIKNTATKILEETKHTFSSKKDHFGGSTKTYRPFEELDKDLPGNEVKPMVTTVTEKLQYTMPYLVKYLDLILQKEKTNAKATANLVIEDETGKEVELAKDIPVTVLVQYEKILVSIRQTVELVPTLDPLQKWNRDPNRQDVYVTSETKRIRTRKMQEPLVLYQATDKHPAQTQLITTDKPVGEFIEILESGALSPLEKSQMLGRIDRLIEGVKRSRARANKTEADNSKIGLSLINLIMGK